MKIGCFEKFYGRKQISQLTFRFLTVLTSFCVCVCGGGVWGCGGVCGCVCGDKDSGDQDLHTGTKSSSELILENL